MKRSETWRHLSSRPLPDLAEPSLLIEKSGRWLVVFDGDMSVKAYGIGLGPEEGDKQREGDGRTPEGEFYVCVKNPRSNFSVSLGLSYPNQEDAQRGLQEGLISRAEYEEIVSRIHLHQSPPWKTPLGGEIMIHGGGNTRDWTAGCVALEDKDILELYPKIPLGTKVIIRP